MHAQTAIAFPIRIRIQIQDSRINAADPYLLEGFYFLFFLSWIFDKSLKFWVANAKMNPTSCFLDHGLHVLKPWSFHQKKSAPANK